MVHEISMCMIEVQIYYTVYDRSTIVRYVLQQEYAVGMLQTCRQICLAVCTAVFTAGVLIAEY